MSVQLMSTVFMADFDDLPWTDDKGEKRNAKASTVKLMLLAYADHANDEGDGSYPGYARLERKTKLSRQGIADTLEAIKQNNFMVFQGWSKLDTHEYSLNKALLESLVKPLDLHPRVKPLDSGESSHLTPVSQATRTESSFTSPTSLTAEEMEQAANLVLLQVQGGKLQTYANRNKFAEVYLPYCDVFVTLTGLKPAKKDLMDWMASFSDWKEAGLTPADIANAYQYATRPEGGFLVTRPGSLTKTATALKAQNSRQSANPVRIVRAEDDQRPRELPDFVKEHAAARGIKVA